jgi:hypothetical protein
MTKLAVLIPYTPDRIDLFKRLERELLLQIETSDVKIIALLTEKAPTKEEPKNTGPSTGLKRNRLVELAIELNAETFAFFDSDDMPGPTYIQRGLEFFDSGMDCSELWGQIYWSGKPGKPFHHYLSCTHAWEDKKQYHRPPNHLNFWRTVKVKDFMFEDKSFGEDMTWAMEIRKSGKIKTMMPIPEVVYHYYVGFPKHAI